MATPFQVSSIRRSTAVLAVSAVAAIGMAWSSGWRKLDMTLVRPDSTSQDAFSMKHAERKRATGIGSLRKPAASSTSAMQHHTLVLPRQHSYQDFALRRYDLSLGQQNTRYCAPDPTRNSSNCKHFDLQIVICL